MESNQQPKRKETQNQLNSYIKYSSLAIQMMLIICIGVYGGYRLDKYLNFDFPLFTILLSFLSVGASIWYAVKDLLKK